MNKVAKVWAKRSSMPNAFKKVSSLLQTRNLPTTEGPLQIRKQDSSLKSAQVSNQILHIRPIGFGFNPDTAQDNKFSRSLDETYNWKELQAKVLQESDIFVNALKSKGVNVLSGIGVKETPDAVFPNNWFSSHSSDEQLQGGSSRFVLYPMTSLTRQIEKRPEIIRQIVDHLHLRHSELIDLSHFEKQGKFLEGTGACIFDRINKIVYVNLSTRADLEVAHALAKRINYDLVTFRSFDADNYPIYHTNVMMSVGTSFCILCEDSIKDPMQLKHVRNTIESSGKTIIPITHAQMVKYCGNALEMAFGDNSGRTFLATSMTAYKDFREDQKREILKHVDEILPIDVTTIETVGGGSVRCMIGELYP